MFWSAWVGHWFPGITPPLMKTITVSQFLGMYQFAKGSDG